MFFLHYSFRGMILRLNGLDEVPDPFYEDLFKEAMEAYTIYGRMESIVSPGWIWLKAAEGR